LATQVRLDGVLPVLPTPFTANGDVLIDDIRREVAWALERGVHGLVVLGVASEVFRLGDNERLRVVEETVRAAGGRVPVVAGAGHLSTALAVGAARAAVDGGASALLVPPPPVGKASEESIVAYYAAVADAVDVPIVLQDDPVHLGIGLSTQTIVRLSQDHPNCSYAKLEELPSMPKIRAVIEATRGAVRCLGGSGGVYVLEELAAGATGIMTGFAFPEALVAVYEAWQRGDRDAARRTFRIVGDLARLEALPGVSISIRKGLYAARGALSSTALRMPAIEVDDWTLQLALHELSLVEAEWSSRSEVAAPEAVVSG
jgi:4-hydroxy-tetrahydrodipicolinate synthase